MTKASFDLSAAEARRIALAAQGFGRGRPGRAAGPTALGRALEQIHPLVVLNFTLGWIAIAVVMLWH